MGAMDGYDAAKYGDRIADVYDDLYPSGPGVDDAVALLADLAAGGAVLELGVGTGRLALPLAARGLTVAGVDASAAMIAKLKAKPGGDSIEVRVGDFGRDRLGADLALVFVGFNTFFGLTEQSQQVTCFANVAAALATAGRFAMEAFVPDLTRFDRGQRTETTGIGTQQVTIDSAIHDPVQQRVEAMHTVIGPDGIALYPVVLRYAWPAELDLMARLAGLELEHRWGGWARQPFTAASDQHVSVWRKPA
jgi:SAM-dependent methyltransferase